VNIDRLTPDEIRERLAAVAEYFPSDEDDEDQALVKPSVGKRKFSQSQRRELASRGHALADGSYPIETDEDLHNAAVLARTGHGDVAGARKLIARRARQLGVANPLNETTEKTMGNTPPGFGRNLSAARVSPSRVAGGPSPAVDDHGSRGQDPMNMPGPKALALGHPDMREGSTTITPWAMLRQRLGDNEFGDRSITRTAGQVGLSILDAAGVCGTYGGMNSMNANPVSRPADHIARPNAVGEGTGRNTLASPAAPPVQAMKASEAREMLRRHMFPGSGRR
jgi:hypothetical protein